MPRTVSAQNPAAADTAEFGGRKVELLPLLRPQWRAMVTEGIPADQDFHTTLTYFSVDLAGAAAWAQNCGCILRYQPDTVLMRLVEHSRPQHKNAPDDTTIRGTYYGCVNGALSNVYANTAWLEHLRATLREAVEPKDKHQAGAELQGPAAIAESIHQAGSNAALDELKALLDLIRLRNLAGDARTLWHRIGVAAYHHSAGSEAGLALWAAWCANQPEVSADAAKEWRAFRGGGATVGCLRRLARESSPGATSLRRRRQPLGLPPVKTLPITRPLVDEMVHRLQWRLIKDCGRDVLLRIQAGGGKTTTVAPAVDAILRLPALDSVFAYISPQQRSPSDPRLETDFREIPSRIPDLYQDINTKDVKWTSPGVKPNGPIVRTATCVHAHSRIYFFKVGGSHANFKDFCDNDCTSRQGCPYLAESSAFYTDLQTHGHKQVRGSIDQLRALKAALPVEDWKQMRLVFDESPQIIDAMLKTIELDWATIDRWRLWVIDHMPDHDRLADFMKALTDLRADASSGFGLNHPQVVKLLAAAVEGIPPPFFDEPFDPSRSDDKHYMPQQPLLLGTVVEAVQDTGDHAIQLSKKGITILSRTRWLRELMEPRVGVVMVLDATGDPHMIEEALGPRVIQEPDDPITNAEVPDTIHHFETLSTEVGPPEMKVYQLKDFGPMGRKVSKSRMSRVDAACTAFGKPHKNVVVFSAQEDRPSTEVSCNARVARGSNQWVSVDAVVVKGLPRPNKGHALSVFRVLHGITADENDPRFEQWYGTQIAAALLQLIYRGRPIGRTSRGLPPLEVLIVADDEILPDLLGVPIEQVREADLLGAPPAGRDQSRIDGAAVAAAVAQLRRAGKAVGGRSVAEVLGVSHKKVRDWAAANPQSWRTLSGGPEPAE